MVKRFFVFVAASGTLLSAATADYFPVQEGNAWTFSYVSSSAPVVSNPPTTKDSGTVKWEIYSNTQTEESFTIGVKQTRNLIHRTLTQSDPSGGYDSIFAPPRTKIDTIFLSENMSLSNGICFPGDTCPFAAHDPAITMPAGLSSKDTTVLFQGTTIAGKRMIVSVCSCLKWYSYSFALGPNIGPVEAYITQCPGLAGVSYKETWKLISRKYPVSVLRGKAPHATLKTVVANQSSGRINCSLNLGYPSPVRIELLDAKGRLIKTLLKGNLNTGGYRFSWNNPIKTSGIAVLRVRTGAKDRCVKIMTGTMK